MLLQQITVVLLCVFLLYPSAFAVVNNAKSGVQADVNSNSNSNTNAASSVTSDSAAASSEKETNRRELPSSGLNDFYGAPPPSVSVGVPFDTYGPPVPSNPGLPVPVYGVPNGPTNNVIYPSPPPDIPPPLPSLPQILPTYGPPKPVYGPPFKFHTSSHHKPQFQKPIFTPAFSHGSFKIPKPNYGPPPPAFISKPHGGPKPIYGPPKISKPFFGPPLKLNFIPPKPVFIPTKPLLGPIKSTGSFGNSFATYGPPHTSLLPVYGPPPSAPVFSPPKPVYGPPKEILHNPPPPIQPAPVYGPPDPIPHGPPHPGAPAPPTPPDIKYDGWQPILGLVSQVPQHGDFNGAGLTPPEHHTDLSLTYASSFAHGSGNIVDTVSHGVHSPSDSYGAPLNTVTGSGGVVSSSGNHHNQFSVGSFGGGSFGGGSFGGGSFDDGSLSVIKSIGYEIFPNNNNGNGGGAVVALDSYGAPPADSFSPDGPYAAALTQNKDSFKSFGSSGLGLIPPSGIYGVPPGGKYTETILSPPKNIGIPNDSYGPPLKLNALEINPPKSPVVFREPVPAGLIQSIGESVAQKDAHGIEHSQSTFQGQSYIPPPVPDITKQNDAHSAPLNPPTNLYSLPNTNPATSFQSVVHGATSTEIGPGFGSPFNLGLDQSSGAALTSYTAPLNVVDSSYGIPLQGQALTSGFDQSFDFTKQTFGGSFTAPYALPQIGIPVHDCSKNTQPLTSYGVPSDSSTSYATSISSLNTNIGGQSNYQIPTLNYANTDTHALQSSVDIQGKSLGEEYFGKNAHFQKSQEIQIPNGVQNIPIQGNLGSYTLQIQSANGLNGQQGEQIPHEQVLSDGLLQSILSAIEQPEQKQQQQQHQQQYAQQQYFQGYGDLQQGSSNTAVSLQKQDTIGSDEIAQQSIPNEVVINPPASEQGNSTVKVTRSSNEGTGSKTEESLPVIDDNEIVLYFNNNNDQNQNTQQVSTSLTPDDKEVRNGQQYGSFVSFKTPHSSYVYGELKSNNGTQSSASISQ